MVKKLDPLTGAMTDEDVEVLAERLADKFRTKLPAAIEQATRISRFMNDNGLPPSDANTLALLIIACGNASRNRRPPIELPIMELILAFVWDELDNGGIKTRPWPKGPAS